MSPLDVELIILQWRKETRNHVSRKVCIWTWCSVGSAFVRDRHTYCFMLLTAYTVWLPAFCILVLFYLPCHDRLYTLNYTWKQPPCPLVSYIYQVLPQQQVGNAVSSLVEGQMSWGFFFWALYSIACSMIDIVWAIEDILPFHKNARLLLYLWKTNYH